MAGTWRRLRRTSPGCTTFSCTCSMVQSSLARSSGSPLLTKKKDFYDKNKANSWVQRNAYYRHEDGNYILIVEIPLYDKNNTQEPSYKIFVK